MYTGKHIDIVGTAQKAINEAKTYGQLRNLENELRGDCYWSVQPVMRSWKREIDIYQEIINDLMCIVNSPNLYDVIIAERT